MRVWLTVDNYDPRNGGGAEWVRDLSLWLTERGYQVGIVCERADQPPPPGCSVLAPSKDEGGTAWQRAQRLQQLLASQPRGLIHDTGGCLLSSDLYHPLMGSRLHNHVRFLRSMPWPRAWQHLRYGNLPPILRLQWQQMRHHRLLIACSPLVADDFAQLGCRSHAVIPNGAVLPSSRPVEQIQALRRRLGAENRLLVLLTSNNHYLKGVMATLRALRAMEPELRSRLRVVVAGHAHFPDFERYLQRHRLEDCCLIEGWVEDIEPYYLSADIFLHPTYHDAGSLSTVKALAAGCAVICTRWDGSSQWIVHGRNGLLLEGHDPASIASVLARLLDEPTRRALGQQARQLIPALSQERCFAAVEEVYRSCLPL